MKYLSKSNYMIFLSCPTKLQFMQDPSRQSDSLSYIEKVNIKQGYELEHLVHEYFKDKHGEEKCSVIEAKFYEMDKSIQETQEKDVNFTVLFEASISELDGTGAYAKSDVRVKNKDGSYDIYEIKASSSVKPEHIIDISYQARIYKEKGIQLRDLYVVTVNQNYVHSNNLSKVDMAKQLLVFNNVNEAVEKKNLKLTQEEVKAIIAKVNSKKYIDREPMRACQKCERRSECWEQKDSPIKIPEYSVLDVLTTSWRTKDKLLKMGVYTIEKMYEMMKRGEFYNSGDKKAPKGSLKLTYSERVDIQSYVEDREFIDKEKLREMLSTLAFPIYSLDYETVSHTVPRFDGVTPRQQIPFQYSIHKLESNGKLSHAEYLQETPEDGRRFLVDKLKLDIDDSKGSVVVYNKNFEKKVNEQLGKYTKEDEWFKDVNDRLWDLMDIFSKRVVYYPEQKTSFSLKATSPALLGEEGDLYKDMGIKNGEEALAKYMDFLDSTLPKNVVRKLMDDLKVYCPADTLLPIYLIRELFKLADMDFPNIQPTE